MGLAGNSAFADRTGQLAVARACPLQQKARQVPRKGLGGAFQSLNSLTHAGKAVMVLWKATSAAQDPMDMTTARHGNPRQAPSLAP